MYMPKSAVPISDDEEYMPKSAVPIDDSSQQQVPTPSLGSRIGDYAKYLLPAGLSQLASIEAMNPKAIPGQALNALKSIPNAGAQIAGELSSMGMPFSPGSQLLNMAPQVVPTPSPQASNAMALAANIAMGVSAIPDLAALGGAGAKVLLNKLSDSIGANADVKANDFISSLLGNNSFSKSHLPVLNEIRNNYDVAQNTSANQYKNILSQAAQQGYTGGKQFPGITAATGEKTIIPNNFQDELNTIDLSEHSKAIQDLLSPINKSVNNNLSFADAHEMQSQLGKEGAKLATSPDGMKRYLGGELLGLRNTLKDDITQSFLANGDTDLANQYQNASDFFKNNVAPYRENSTIRNVVMKSGLKEINPATIGNVLKKEDGSILPIANDLSPQSKNLLLANQLKSSTQQLPEQGVMQRSTDATRLLNNFGQLDNRGFSNLITPEHIQAIENIKNDLAKQGTIKWALDKLRIPALTGSAALGGSAGYHLGKLFF